MQINQNIRQARLLAKLSQQKVADIIGEKRSTYAEWENNTMPQADILSKISSALNVPMADLLSDKPIEPPLTVLNEQTVDYLKERRDKKNGTKEIPIPMYFGNTRAGTIQVYSDDPEMQAPVGHLPASIFPGCNHAEKISGDSMYPLICNQAYLIGKVIDKRGIIWGEKYIIHTKYGQSMVKYVHPSTEKQFIKIVSHNKTIPTQDLPLDDITFVCRVHFIVNPS